MILVITHKEDFTADFVINKLNQRAIKYRRLNCEDIFKDEYLIGFTPDFNYSLLGEEEFSSVWFRRTKLPQLEGLSNADKFYILSETEAFYKNLFSSISSNWLSLPNSVYEAENKILQLQFAKRIGFTIPPTLVTNSKDKLRKFFLDCNEEMILKPISQTRIQYQDTAAFIFTNPVPREFIDGIDEYDLTPCIFQKHIKKEYELRITVVGEVVFPAVVYSQEDEETKNDWRKKKLQFHAISLPMDIEKMCIQIVKDLDLKFGAIDLIKSTDGEYYFLEINPNGQWAWIETQTGQNISDEIIKLLINHDYAKNQKGT